MNLDRGTLHVIQAPNPRREAEASRPLEILGAAIAAMIVEGASL